MSRALRQLSAGGHRSMRMQRSSMRLVTKRAMAKRQRSSAIQGTSVETSGGLEQRWNAPSSAFLRYLKILGANQYHAGCTVGLASGRIRREGQREARETAVQLPMSSAYIRTRMRLGSAASGVRTLFWTPPRTISRQVARSKAGPLAVGPRTRATALKACRL